MTLQYSVCVTRNSEMVKKSKFCYCVCCLEKYPASEVNLYEDDMIQDVNGFTVMCPKCGVDSVVPDAFGEEVTESLLREWNRTYFYDDEFRQ
ncbi:hypothetical protein ABK040_000008 [Willaertia magna]